MPGSFVTGSHVYVNPNAATALPVAVQAGDKIIVVASQSTTANLHCTAKDQNNVNFTESVFKADGVDGSLTITILELDAPSGYTPTITVTGAASWGAFAWRGEQSGNANATGTGGGDFSGNPVLTGNINPSGISSGVVLFSDSADNFSSINAGGGSAYTQLQHTASDSNGDCVAYGYVLGQAGSTNYTPGANIVTGGGSGRAVVAAAYFLETNGPTISSPPANATVSEPSTATFSVTASASGGGTLSYQWQYSKDGGNTFANVTLGSGGTSSSFTTAATSNAEAANNYVYRCTVTETGGSSPGSTTSNVAYLTVLNNKLQTDDCTKFPKYPLAQRAQGLN